MFVKMNPLSLDGFWSVKRCLIGIVMAMQVTLSPVSFAQTLDEYFAEPANLPFDEEVQEQKQEDGWHWTEFRYTSLIYQGEPIRIHAIYAVPNDASATHKVPVILATRCV